MPENYLSKTIEAPSGINAVAWDGQTFKADLHSGRGSVVLAGYLDEAAFVAQKTPLHHVKYDIADITQLAEYENFFGEALTKFVADENNLWYQGGIVPCPLNEYGRILTKDLEVESGATANAWRCVGLHADLKADKAYFTMRGWKDVDSFCAGKKPASGRSRNWVVEMPVSGFTTYPALYSEIVGVILADSEAELYGATLTATS